MRTDRPRRPLRVHHHPSDGSCLARAAGLRAGSLTLALALALAGACHGSGIDATDGPSPSPDAGAGARDGAGAPDGPAFTPAPHPPLPLIPNHGGAIMTDPSFVSILWKGDPFAPRIQAFQQWLPKSAWFATLAEYGVHAGTLAGTHVIDAPPPTLADKDLRDLLASLVASAAIPPPTANRMYLVYLPPGAQISYDFGGMQAYQSCTAFYSYHSAIPRDSGPPLVYAVLPRCHGPAIGDEALLTASASAEIGDTVASPSYTDLGWMLTSYDANDPWGGGVADLCASHQVEVDGFTVTRLYSNQAAAADRRPCLPAPPGPMFRAPATPDIVHLAPGQSTTVTLGVYTTAPVATPLDLTASSYDPVHLTVSASQATASNGDKVTLTLSLAPSVVGKYYGVVPVRVSDAGYHVQSYVIVRSP